MKNLLSTLLLGLVLAAAIATTIAGAAIAHELNPTTTVYLFVE